jgi:hypothetical protein
VERIIIVVLLFWVNIGLAQKIEHFSLFTDRDVYSSGETILFHVYLPSGEGSSLINVNLLNTNGKIISSVNKKIANDQINGFIYIPDSLKSGTYLLAATSRVNPIITFREVVICNQFTGITELGTILRATGTIPIIEKQAQLRVTGLEKSYKARSNAEVLFNIPSELLSRINDGLMVSVAEFIPGVSLNSFSRKIKSSDDKIIENRGIVYDGFLKDSDTGAAFSNGYVYLSVPDSIPVLQYFITGENGRFHFRLDDYYGKIPVVIQAFDPGKKRLVKIVPDRLDSITDYLPSFEAGPVPEELMKVLGSTIEATTLRKIFDYHEVLVTVPPARQKSDYSFYGVPTEIVFPALFMDLPDFTEVSRELLPGVKFRAYNRIPTLQILNPGTLNYFIDPPLVLLNGVPVQDLNVIKNLGSKEIDRIEVCRRERFFGDLVFPGVIAIFSSKQVNKLLLESDELIKISLEAMQPDAILNIPKTSVQNEPDLRKVLLWNPYIKPQEMTKIDFVTSDIKGSYKISIRGMTKDGEVICHEQIFEVN